MVPSMFKKEQELLLKNMREKNKLKTGYTSQDSVHELQGTEAQTGFRKKKKRIQKENAPHPPPLRASDTASFPNGVYDFLVYT